MIQGNEAELRRIHETPEVRRWWDVPSDDFPWDEPEATRLVIEIDGAIAGLVMSKQRAASIANASGSSSKGGKKSGKGRGGSKSQKRAAGREGGKKS